MPRNLIPESAKRELRKKRENQEKLSFLESMAISFKPIAEVAGAAEKLAEEKRKKEEEEERKKREEQEKRRRK
jgi:hypothetical protein